MARIAGIDLPKEKRVEIALTYIYGVGRAAANRILKSASVDPDKRTKALTGEEIAKITTVMQGHYKIEGDLRRDISANIKRLMDIGSYRGSRHKKGLPARGQRTKTNARTRKGPRRTVGAIKAAAKAATEQRK